MRMALLLPLLALLASCKAVSPSPQRASFVPPPPSPPADNAPICARPDEVAAFRKVALQTELMQTALSCHGDAKYGTFVTTYKADLVAQRDILAGFFKRAYGARSQSAFDGYMTQLANAQSQQNLKSGELYCGFGDEVLDHAQSLKTQKALDDYAAQVPVQQSLNVQACGSPSAPPEMPPVVKKSRRVRKHKT